MIINKLELYNFRQYVGHQSVEFSTDKDKNVTVLIGINTSGKTTIVRAFEWCLYGKNGFDDPVLLNSNVRSNMNTGDKQETWVAVTFTHDNLVYTIKRSFRYTCTERRKTGDDVEVMLKKPEENLTLEYLQHDGQTKTPINRADITESMDRVLPQDLSDYFFFGGERISGIANRTDLSKAVRGLMRLDVLENAREHLSKVIKSFHASIDTSGDESAEKARDAIETYTQQLHVFEEDRDNAEKQMQYWDEQEKKYASDLAKSDIEQVKKAKAERDRLEKTLAAEKLKLENDVQALIDAFNTRPFSFFGMPALKQTLQMLESVKETTECVPGMDQDAIDYLIARKRCICGTQLLPGSLSYEKLWRSAENCLPRQLEQSSITIRIKQKAT